MRPAFLRRYIVQQSVIKLLVWSCLFLSGLALGIVGLIRVLPALLSTPEQIDFGAYYVAARLLNAGGRLYDPAAMRDVAAQAGSIHYTAYIYPPFFAALLRPLTVLPYLPAQFCWLGLNVILWVGAVATLCRLVAMPRALYIPIVALTALLPAVYDTLLLGQTSLVITALLVASLFFGQDKPSRRSEILAGVLLGLAVSIKLYPAVLGLVYLVHRRVTTLVAAGTTCVLAGIVGIVFGGGWDATVAFVTYILPHVAQLSPFPSNQSLRGVLARFFSYNEFSVPVLSKGNPVSVSLRPLVDAPALGTGLAYGLGIALVAISLWRMLRAQRLGQPDTLFVRHFGLVITVMLLITPVVWDNYFTHLLIPLFALRYGRGGGELSPLAAVCACLLLMLQRYWRVLLLYAQTPFLMLFGCAATLLLWGALLTDSASLPTADVAL